MRIYFSDAYFNYLHLCFFSVNTYLPKERLSCSCILKLVVLSQVPGGEQVSGLGPAGPLPGPGHTYLRGLH